MAAKKKIYTTNSVISLSVDIERHVIYGFQGSLTQGIHFCHFQIQNGRRFQNGCHKYTVWWHCITLTGYTGCHYQARKE